MTAIKLYLRMSRPTQLAAVVLVYGWGTLMALRDQPAFDLAAFLTGLLTLLLVSASIHYANEYADYETDALTVRTPFSGGSGAMQDYGAPRQTALVAAWLSLIMGSLLAIIELLTGFLPMIALMLLALGAFGGWMYSLRPLALAWRGWGEVDNAILGGILLPVYGFCVQSDRLELASHSARGLVGRPRLHPPPFALSQRAGHGPIPGRPTGDLGSDH